MKCGTPEELAILRWFVSQAKQIVGCKRALLFGSRARGDAEERSDFDIAIEAEKPESLAELRALLEENPVTLLAFDVVDLNSAEEKFRERILKEAVDITFL